MDHHEGDPWLVALLQLGARLTHLTQLVLKHLEGVGQVGKVLHTKYTTHSKKAETFTSGGREMEGGRQRERKEVRVEVLQY